MELGTEIQIIMTLVFIILIRCNKDFVFVHKSANIDKRGSHNTCEMSMEGSRSRSPSALTLSDKDNNCDERAAVAAAIDDDDDDANLLPSWLVKGGKEDEGSIASAAGSGMVARKEGFNDSNLD